MDQVGVLVAF